MSDAITEPEVRATCNVAQRMHDTNAARGTEYRMDPGLAAASLSWALAALDAERAAHEETRRERDVLHDMVGRDDADAWRRVERLARALSSLTDAARAHDERMRAEGIADHRALLGFSRDEEVSVITERMRGVLDQGRGRDAAIAEADAAGYARGVEDAARVCEACAAQMASAPKPTHVDRELLREVADRVQQRCVARAEHHRGCDHVDHCDPACPVLAIVKVHDQIDAIIDAVLSARGAR